MTTRLFGLFTLVIILSGSMAMAQHGTSLVDSKSATQYLDENEDATIDFTLSEVSTTAILVFKIRFAPGPV